MECLAGFVHGEMGNESRQLVPVVGVAWAWHSVQWPSGGGGGKRQNGSRSYVTTHISMHRIKRWSTLYYYEPSGWFSRTRTFFNFTG